MEFKFHRETNDKNDESMIIIINYTPEETAALTQTKSWEKSCLPKMKIEVGFFRSTKRYSNPTFRQFVDPGFRVRGFTQLYATYLQNCFEDTYRKKIQKRLAPILEEYRNLVHHERAQQRDEYFGASSNARAIR